MTNRTFDVRMPLGTFEGAGGLLTVLDTEESPLSKMQAARLTPGAREGRHWNRNEPSSVKTMNSEEGGCAVEDETAIPAGASPSRSADAHLEGPGRMLS